MGISKTSSPEKTRTGNVKEGERDRASRSTDLPCGRVRNVKTGCPWEDIEPTTTAIQQWGGEDKSPSTRHGWNGKGLGPSQPTHHALCLSRLRLASTGACRGKRDHPHPPGLSACLGQAHGNIRRGVWVEVKAQPTSPILNLD